MSVTKSGTYHPDDILGRQGVDEASIGDHDYRAAIV